MTETTSVVDEAPAAAAPATVPTPATSRKRRSRAVVIIVVALASTAGALGAAWMSGRLGSWSANEPALPAMATRDRVAMPGAPRTPAAGDLAPLLARLATKLQKAPDDPEGWALLARGYVEIGRHAEAVPAFRMAVDKGKPDAQLLADFADALGVTQGRKLAGEPAQLARRALALDARHPKALALAGSAAFEAGDYASAIAHWQVLQSVLPPDSTDAANVAANIAEAQALADGATPGETSLAAAIAAKLGTPGNAEPRPATPSR
jgi:cytochrome c-type biogenesis protein CcmH